MFREVLLVKPQLEPGTTRRMELTLTQRFARVTKRFGQGLKAIVTGTALGIGLNILAKILNPIQELEEKMNALLGKGKNIADLSDRFGTDAGKLQRLQIVGERLGVEPEELSKLMEKYAEAIETGRDEVLKPLKEQSEATKLLSQDFLQEKDLAESFFKFIQTLRTITDPAERGRVEKEILGERLFGFKRRFADANFNEELKSVPGADVLRQAVGNVAATDEDVRVRRVNREAQSFINQASTLSPSTSNAIAALEAQRQQKEDRDFARFNELAVTAKGVEEAMSALKKPLELLQTGIAKLVVFTETLSKSRWFRNLTGSK